MENNVENKKKRFYKVGEVVWVLGDKREGTVTALNKATLEVTVNLAGEPKTMKVWEIDKLKYRRKSEVDNLEADEAAESTGGKTTYFASVAGGVIPTKNPENAGRDAYARLEPVVRDGIEIFELHIPQLTLAKIPLGFASYLDVEDFLSLKHERSSIGGVGMINVSGLIDSTYQGEVILQVVPLVADVVITSEVEEKFFDEETNIYFIPYHKAIAQAVVIPQSQAEDVHISYDKLKAKPSTRGTGGWGSTNK